MLIKKPNIDPGDPQGLPGKVGHMNCLRNTVLMLVVLVAGSSGLAATSPLTADQTAVLDAARAYALAYTKKLPDFICTQITDRTRMPVAGLGSAASSAIYRSANEVHGSYSMRVEEKLTFFNQQEHYEVVSVNDNKPNGAQHQDFRGPVSSGEFGSALYELFDPRSMAAFKFDRMEDLRGRSAFVFSYQVPQETGMRVNDGVFRREIVASYKGFVFVDADTKEVMRITAQLDLPTDFSITRIERSVDYRPTSIAGKNYNLPFHAQLQLNAGGLQYANDIHFKKYQKFAVESTIRFGNLTEKPVPPAPQASPIPPAVNEAGLSSSAAPAPVEPMRKADQETAAVVAQPHPEEKPAAAPEPPLSAASKAAEPVTVVANEPPPSPTLKIELPQPAPAVSAAGTPFQLHLRVDLVTVPVVVRDAKGRAVGGLTQENFELFDKGKRQQITSFAVQAEAGESAGNGEHVSAPVESATGGAAGSAPVHWVVYLFDDMHLKFEDLTRVRDAAQRHIAKLQATDRAGIVSTSGLVVVQFTTDKTRLLEALLKIHANPAGAGSSTQGCPEISYYEADQILRGSPTDMSSNLAWQVATQDMVACSGMPSDFAARAALAKARMVDEVSGQEVRSVISVMKDVIKGLANAPGTRTIVLISPGFMLPVGTGLDEGDVVEEAIRAQVVISSLDARGLYVESWVSDIDRGGGGPQAFETKTAFKNQEAMVNSGVLSDFANGTGGSVVRNTNDLDGGFERLTRVSEITYLLGFKPADLKADGSFHPLTVKLDTDRQLSLQARKGYFAPSR